MLYMPVTETGPFRSEVEKLMVSPNHRFKGIARRLMAKLEDEAKARDRWLVVSCPYLPT
jgi:GNAT superfamily N-acetyltransferase